MGKAIGILVLALLIGLGAWTYGHYSDCYSAVLLPPNEEWLNLRRDHYARLGPGAGNVRHAMTFMPTTGVMAAVITENDGLFDGGDDGRLGERSRAMLEQRSEVAGVRECRGVSTDQADWACLEWTVKPDGVPVRARQRMYLAHRGSTTVGVTFMAVPEHHFRAIGDTAVWLRDLDWRGPGIGYAF